MSTTTSLLSRKECEDLKPWVESTVRKVLGFSESSVAHAALGCMEKGFDKRKTKATLVDLLDERVADRFVERLFLELDLQRAALSSSPSANKSAANNNKRNRPDPTESDIADMIKKTRYEAASAAAASAAAAAANGANNNQPHHHHPRGVVAAGGGGGGGFAALPSATLAALNAVAAQVDNIPDVNDPALKNAAQKPPPPPAAHSMTTTAATTTPGGAAAAAAAAAGVNGTAAAVSQQQQQPPSQQQVPPPPPGAGPAAEASAAAPVPTPLTPDQIKAMMENAKKMIAAKKAAAAGINNNATANATAAAAPSSPLLPLPTSNVPVAAAAAAASGVGRPVAYHPPAPRPMFPTEEPDLPIPGGRSKVINAEEQDKLKRAAQLQAQIKAKLQSMTMVPDLMTVENKAKEAAVEAAKIAAEKKPQAPKLIIDAEGRTLDADGNEITIAPRVPELKANLRASQREAMKSGISSVIPGVTSSSAGVPVLHPSGVVMKATPEPEGNKYLDSRIELKSAGRSTKRAFKFHDAGKFQQMASRLRTKAQLEKLQNQVSLAAKKTGISSATKLAGLMQPTKPKALEEGEIPVVEWWDYYILEDANYESLEERGSSAINYEVITNLIEHPLQLPPPTEVVDKPVHLPIMLTKRERKKLRRQTRNEALKEKTEKVRLGLEAPPEPKMRISNLMRVLGTEAVADPTKMEAHVRAQMAKRQRAHEEANAKRKLTPEQRSEKKTKKMAEDTSAGVQVAVYRIKSLSDPAKKFKVETNATQLQMTGAVVMCKENNIVIVEGGPKQQKKFRRLLLHRIKWEEASRKEKRDEASSMEDGEGGGGGGASSSSSSSSSSRNVCSLVWEGTVMKRSFGEIKFKVCPTESFAREHLRQRNVEHYWDIAHADSVIESSAD